MSDKPDATLIDVCQDFIHTDQNRTDIFEAHTKIDPPDDVIEPLEDRLNTLAPVIWNTPATSPAGIKAKAAALLSIYPEIADPAGDWRDRFIASILADLEQL
jgi:hypothetical protein